MSELISIGKVLNFHGIKGEVKVGYTRGNEDRIESLKAVFIDIDGNEEKITKKQSKLNEKIEAVPCIDFSNIITNYLNEKYINNKKE